MAEAFNLTAQLNLRGPSNIRQIVSDVKKQIGAITGEVKFKIDSSSINNTSKLNQSLQSLNANLANVSSNAQSASAAIRSFGQSVNGIASSSSKLSNNISKASKSADNLGNVSSKVSKNVAVARTEMEEFGRQSALAVRRFAAFSAVTGVFFSLNRAINSGLKSFIEFDRQLVRLQQVTGQNAAGLQDLQDEIVRLSVGLGVSSDSLISVSSTLAQAGLSATQTKAALEALAKSELAPSFDNIAQTTEGAIALMRQFGISANELEKALGSVNSVAAAFAVESSDIISAIQRTGGVFASASKGVSEGTDALNEFIAVFTSVRATTRESAETIATGLRTIFTRIQRAGTIEALKEFGVTLTDSEGKFVGAYKAVQLLSEGLNRIDPRDLRFSQIVEELGGFRQIGKVIPLIQQFATAQEALKVAQAGQGSLATDAVKAQLSLANQISKVREEFLSLIRSLGQSDTFQTLAKGALGFASGLIKISGALKGVLPALAILAAGTGARALTQFTGGFVGGLKKVPQTGIGDQDAPRSIAGSIGQNLGASLVGAKTEQVSRDLDQNSAALDKVSGKLDSLVTSLNSLNSNFNSINNLLNSNNSLLQQSISSLTNNTSSLDSLTNAINNLNLGGAGSTTARDGGVIRKFARGGTVPAMVSNGEGWVPPEKVSSFRFGGQSGYKALDMANQADRNEMRGFASGGISKFKGPGTGTSDSIRTNLSIGGYVLRADAMKEIASNKEINKNIGRQRPNITNKYSNGGAIPIVLSHTPMSLNNIDEYGMDNTSKGAVKGLMFENDFARDYGIRPQEQTFPDITNPGLVRSIAGNLAPEAIGLELKYEDNSNTRRAYLSGLKQNGYKSEQVPMGVRAFRSGKIQRLWSGGVADLAKIYPIIESALGYEDVEKLIIRDNSRFQAVSFSDINPSLIENFQKTKGSWGDKFETLISEQYNLDRSLRKTRWDFLDFPAQRAEVKFMKKGATYNDEDGKGNTEETIAAKNYLFENSLYPPNIPNQRVSELWPNIRNPAPATVYYPENPQDFFKPMTDADYARYNMPNPYSIGGIAQKFKIGGVAAAVQRRVGYIDYDVIADPDNASIVEPAMEQLGIKGPRLYTEKLTQLAVAARKTGNLPKLNSTYGVAGRGKTTLASRGFSNKLGLGTDKGTLRETTRFPVLTPEDIQKATEIMLISSSVSQNDLKNVFVPSDTPFVLSTSTKEEQQLALTQRELRDQRGDNQNRAPGSSLGAPLDSSVGEALIRDANKKATVLTTGPDGRLRRKRGNELVETVKSDIDLIQGSFSPFTGQVPTDSSGNPDWTKAFGHMGLMGVSRSTKPSNIPVFLVGPDQAIDLDAYTSGDTHSARNLLFPQELRLLLARATLEPYGGIVVPKAKDFAVPSAFDITRETDSRRKVLIAGDKSRALFAEKTDKEAKKYSDAKYKPVGLTRTVSPEDDVAVSGTRIRDMIMSGDFAGLQKVLSVPAYEIISNNISKLQNRSKIIPAIIKQTKEERDIQLKNTEDQIKTVGISRIDQKKLADPEYAAKVQILQELRDKRDKIKSAASFKPYKLLSELSRLEPDKYGLDLTMPRTIDPKPIRTVGQPQKANNGGYIQKFSKGSKGGVTPKIQNRIAPDFFGASHNDNSKVSGDINAVKIGSDLYSVQTVGVSKPGEGYGVPLYDSVLDQVSKKGSWLTSSRTDVSDNARAVWDYYRKKRPDVKNKLLPMQDWYLSPLFNGQIDGQPTIDSALDFPDNLAELKKHENTWPDKNHPEWSLQYAYQKKIKKMFGGGKIQKFSSGGYTVDFDYPDADSFDDTLLNKGLAGIVTQATRQFTPKGGKRDVSVAEVKAGMGNNFNATKGNIYEMAVRKVGQNLPTSTNANFDYNEWPGPGYVKGFDLISKQTPTDAKISTGAASVDSFSKKIANYQQDEIGNKGKGKTHRRKYGAIIFEPYEVDKPDALTIKQEQVDKYKYANGGYIQKFMAGSVGGVKGRKADLQMDSITLEELKTRRSEFPVSRIIEESGGILSVLQTIFASGLTKTKTSSGKETDFTAADIIKLLKKRRESLTPTEANAIDKVYEKYIEEYNKKSASNRGQSVAATSQAMSNKLLFGAVGMYGSPFRAETVTLTKDDYGLKKDTDVRLFGAVLDQDKSARQVRLQARKERLTQINDKRATPTKYRPIGKTPLTDRFSEYTESAPTAAELDEAYLREDLKGITDRNNNRIITRVINVLSDNKGKAFFDFDDTLAENTDPAGYTRSGSDKPDYSLFGNEIAVREGLFGTKDKSPAKPTELLKSIISLVQDTGVKLPDQISALLSSMHVITARPQNTTSIIQEWLASKGLVLPSENVTGVGAVGMSTKDVAVAKAKKILESVGSQNNIFVDDNTENKTVAGEFGINSAQYGAQLDADSFFVRKGLEDSQGTKFQNDILMELMNADPLLYRAISQDTESSKSIDFPYGLGNKIAKGWFNNSLLANIPVDAKRTLTGPRGIFSYNVANYLKAKGYKSGGTIQGFKDGSPGGLRLGTGEGRGQKGPRGGRSKIKELSETELAQLSTEDLIAYAKAQARDIFSTSGAGMAVASEFIEVPKERIIPELEDDLTTYLGKRGFWREIISPFAGSDKARVPKERKMDARTLRSMVATAGGVESSALKDVSMETLLKYAEQAPRAPKDVLEATIKRYQNDPEFMIQEPAAAGGTVQDTILQRVKDFANGGSFAGVLDIDQATRVKKAIEQLKSQNEPKTKSALENFDRIVAGERPEVPGQVKAFQWALNQVIKNGLVSFNDDGKIQRFMAGSAGRVKQKPQSFGTGHYPFPSRVVKAYEQRNHEETTDSLFSRFLRGRVFVDEDPVIGSRMLPEGINTQKAEPKNTREEILKRFRDSYKSKVTKDSLAEKMIAFGEFVGVQPDILTDILPYAIDSGYSADAYRSFGFSTAKLSSSAVYSQRNTDGIDLAPYGFYKADEQDLFGYEFLVSEKEKQIKNIEEKIIKAQSKYDKSRNPTDSQTLSDLKQKKLALDKEKIELRGLLATSRLKKTDAKKLPLSALQERMDATGRSILGFDYGEGDAPDSKILYHELTHQLLNVIKKRSPQTYAKYTSGVARLFEGDNDDVSDAFDVLSKNSYKSADIAYGRQYKLNALLNEQLAINSNKKLSNEILRPHAGQSGQEQQRYDRINSIRRKGDSAIKAKEFKPINPEINEILIKDLGASQEAINKMEDNGKEEFLTTLVENFPVLDSHLQSILDNTLTELLEDADIKRQQYKVGGSVQRFGIGGVPALVSNGEGYVDPMTARSIGYGTLNRMNQADRNGLGRFARGGISKFKGPGTGTSDSIRTNLPVGSYIIRKNAMDAMGFNKGGAVGVQRFAFGGQPGSSQPKTGINLTPGLDEPLGIIRTAAIMLANSFKSTTGLMTETQKIFDDMGVSGTDLGNAIENYAAELLSSGKITVDQLNLMIKNYAFALESLRKSSVADNEKETVVKQWVAALNITRKQITTPASSKAPTTVSPTTPSTTIPVVPRPSASSSGSTRSYPMGMPPVPPAPKVPPTVIPSSSISAGPPGDFEAKIQKLLTEFEKAGKQAGILAYENAKAAGSSVALAKAAADAASANAVNKLASQKYAEGIDRNVLMETRNRVKNDPSLIRASAADVKAARGAATVSGAATIVTTSSTANPTKPLVDASVKAADQLKLLSILASQSGVSLKTFKQNLERDIGSTFMNLKNEIPKLIGSVRANVAQHRDKLTSTDKDEAQNAKQSLGEDIRRTVGSSEVSGISNEQIDKFIDDLSDKLKNTSMTFDEAIDSVSGLKDALNNASTEAQLQSRATEMVSASSGVAKATLDTMAESAINASKSLKETEKLSSRLAKTALAVGAAGSVLSSIIKTIGGSENKSGMVAGAAVEGASSTFSTITAARSQALPALDAASAMASKMGGPIGKLAGSLLPMAKNLIAGPFGLVATAAISAAAALKDAHNAAREFDLNQTKKRLDESINRVNNLFDEFSKDTSKLDILGKIDQELRYGSQQLIKNLQTDLTVPKAFWMNLLDVGLSSGGEQARTAGRSMILEKEGSLSYLQASFDNNYQQRAIARLAPEKAVETAQKVQPQGQNILKQFENRLRSGTSQEDILKELKVAGNETATVLARMNPKINEQIMLIENDKSISEQNRKSQVQQIIATEANRVAAINMKNSMKEIEFEKLNRQTNNFATSLERMFNGMDQAINKVGFELDKLSRSAELSAAALSGNAKAGDVMLDSINVIQNPRAYSGKQQGAAYDQAAGMFGSQEGLIRPLLGLGDKLESTVMQTINRSVQANPTGTTESIAGNIERALDKQLKDLGLPSNITDKLAQSTRRAFEKIRSERGGEDTQLSFDQITEEVPAFAKSISSAQRAQEMAVKAMEFYQKNLNEYAQAMNQMVDFQIEANSRMRKATEIQAKGNMELSRTLGKRITLDESRKVSEAPIKSMTGGLTDARDIGRNVVNLENTRRVQQASADGAANRGPAGKDEFALMQNRLRGTNTALRENIDALKQMADSTELAQAALAEIQEVQAKRQAGVNLIEKMVTSSPEELAKLNASIGRLNNNMRGGLNIGSTSEQRGETLQTFNMLAPLLGDGQKQNELKANVLESMLKESGVGIDSTFQEVLNSLRDPEGDPQMAEAISVYKESLNKQTEANRVLSVIQNLMSQNTAEIAATKLANAIGSVKLNFDQQVMSDIREKIQVLIDVVKKNAGDGKNPIPVAGKKTGGIIYASMGRAIDFTPKGTDTVPAMLTPGEFVVNRNATRDNLPLLQNINSGKYSNGGKVRYYNHGGYVLGQSSIAAFGKDGKELEDAKNISQEKVTASKSPGPLVTSAKLPIISSNWKDSLTKLGTIESDFFIGSGSDGQAAVGQSFKQILLGYGGLSKGGISSTVLKQFGEQQTIKPKYRKSLLFGIKDPKGIISEESKIPTDNIRMLEPLYKEIFEFLIKGPSGTVHPEKIYQEVSTELPNIPLRLIESRKRKIEGYDIKYQIDNIIQKNKKPYFGFFDKVPNYTSPGGPGFKDDYKDANYLFWNDQTFSPSLARFSSQLADGLNNKTGSYKANNSRNEDLTNEILQPKEYVANTINTIQKLRYALKSIGKYNNINLRTENSQDSLVKQETKLGKNILGDIGQEESSESIKNKETIASLDALYNKKVFSIDLDDPDYVREPVTLYNLDEIKWNTIKDSIGDKYTALVKQQQAPGGPNEFTRLTKLSDDRSHRDFPWISQKASIDRNALFSQSQVDFSGEASKNLLTIEETPLGSENGRYFIPGAKTITGPRFNTTTRNYDTAKTTPYIYIPPNNGVAGLNPLYSATKPIVYTGDASEFDDWLNNRLPYWDKTTKTEKPPTIRGFEGDNPKINLSNGIGLTNKINTSEFSILKDLDKNISDYLVPYDGHKFILETATIDATEFKKARDERIKTADLQISQQNAQKVSGARFDKLTAEEKSFPAETRTKLAQRIQRSASAALSNYGISVPNITKIEDVGGVSNYLNRYLSSVDNKSVKWAEINAWRAFFQELYKSDQNTVPYLKSLGIDVTNPDRIHPDSINNIIAREKAAAIGKNVSGEIPAESLKNGALDLETTKTKLYTVGADGKKTEISAENIKNPATIQDIEEISLAPENMFENATKRKSYLDVLFQYFKDNNLIDFSNAITKLKTWYGAQDSLLHMGLNNPDLQNSLNALNEEKSDPDLTKQVEIINNKKNYDPSNQLLTAERYGSLPDVNRMKDLIRVRIEEAKSEQQKVENAGGFAKGGLIYASGGQLINFQPKGTDTVPAMLTPGEFVINRNSTQKYRPVLEAINNGSYSRGGIVNYLQHGGYLPLYRQNGGSTPSSASFDFTSFMNGLTIAVATSITEAFDKALNNLKQPNNASGGVSNNNADLASIDNFVNRLNNIANILSNIYIPPQITITGKHDVVVTINGDTVLNQLRPDIAGIVVSAIKGAFRDLKAKNPENNTINFDIDINPSKL